MAGLYSFFGPRDDARLNRAADELQFADNETRFLLSGGGFNLVWTGINDPAHFGPAHDPASGVHVITAGRVSWDEPDWRRAEQLTQFEGGLSNRLLLHDYLRGGASALERHNGPALLVAWDPRDHSVHAFTDHMGYHPVFVYRPDDVSRCVLATSADAIAADGAVDATPDLLTMAETLRFWRATPPHTYYQEIKYAGPATRWTWNLADESGKSRSYWEPFQTDPFPSPDAAAEELAGALEHAVRIRTLKRLGPVAAFVSGGMDSRSMVFGASDPSTMVGINLFDEPNVEADIARRVCEAAGVAYVPFQRDTDFYPRTITESARLSGAMWSAQDSHFLGVADVVQSHGARTVLTGCTADRVFKGSPLETRYRRLFGRNLPIKELSPAREDTYLPNYARGYAGGKLLTAVMGRFEERFDGTPRTMSEDADWLAVEDRRVRPNCYGSSVSGPIMYRVFPYDTFLADRAVVDCYGRMRAAWKVNANVWGKAVARLSGVHHAIPISNAGWRLDDSVARILWAFGKGWVSRRLRPTPTASSNGPAGTGSWPVLGWYVLNSETIRQEWSSVTAAERERIAQVWGMDPWTHPLTYWARRPTDVFRFLTLVAHWRANPTLAP